MRRFCYPVEILITDDSKKITGHGHMGYREKINGPR